MGEGSKDTILGFCRSDAIDNLSTDWRQRKNIHENHLTRAEIAIKHSNTFGTAKTINPKTDSQKVYIIRRGFTMKTKGKKALSMFLVLAIIISTCLSA